MSFDREKLRRTAEKNLAQGKIQAAIRDYCQIVENDPRDYNTLNMLGDLHVRVGRNDEAVKCFTKIAEHYNQQGFTHKAIAMYKKIGRVKPGAADVSAKLAPLYQALGLVAEARTNYQAIAEEHQKGGRRIQALEVWQQIADLDPNDTNTRLKLAESFLKENEVQKALEAYTEAGQRLLAKKQFESALSAFNQALALQPHYLSALSGLTLTNIALGFPDEAIEKLENALNVMPDNADLLSLLAHCYVEMGNAEAAERTTVKLIEKEPSSYKRMLEVCELQIRQGDLKGAVRSLETSAEPLLSNAQEADLEKLLNEILARDPEHLKALRLMARLRGWQRDELELKDILERLAEAARLNESFEEERNALSELRSLFPSETQYAERMREITGDSVFQEDEAAPQNRENNVPSFESFAPFESENETGFALVDSPRAERFGANDYEIERSSESQTYRALDSQIEPEDESTIEISFGESNENAQADFEVTEIIAPDESSPIGNPANAQSNNELHLYRELESIDFYIEQGYNELALDSLKTLESQYGAIEEIQTRRDSILSLGAADTLDDQASNRHRQNGNYSAIENGADSAAQFETRTEIYDASVSADLNSNGVQNFAFEVEPLSDEQPKPAAPEHNPNFADLLAELGDDLQVGEMREVQTADYETHYNLGLAYKEMGLFDDAVEEFQTAVKMISPDDGTPRYLQCCNLIGHCFVEKGMPHLAAKWYQRALESPGHTDEEHQALLYELGTAYERSGDTQKAVEVFGEIYAVNVAYRSVGDKLRSLQAMR